MKPHHASRGALRACLLLLIFGGFFYLGSCRKSDAVVDTHDKKAIPDWVMENIKKAPKSFTVPVNQKSTAIFLDKQGNERPANFWRNRAASGSRDLTIPCDPFEDDFEDNVFTYVYTQVTFYGYNTTGFEVETEFTLSTAFNIEPHQPGDPTKPTSGRIRVKDRITSAILYNYTNLTLTYTSLGPDPSTPGKTLYKLKFKTPLINDPDIDILDVYFDVRPIVYTDCEEVIITTPNWQGLPYGVIGADVCGRTDNIGIQPAGSGLVYISGCVAGTSTYPSGVLIPHQQEVEFDAGSGWTPMLFSLNSCTQTQKLFPTDVWTYSLSPGTIKFRWRNIKHTTNNCSPNYAVSCQGPYYEVTLTVP